MANQSAAVQRLEALFDAESFMELEQQIACGVAIGYGTVAGKTVCAFSQDKQVLSGAVDQKQAQKINRIYTLAFEMGCPIVGIYDSAGVEVTQGGVALRAFSQIMELVNRLSGVVPQISLVLGTCVGTAALLAASTDFIVTQQEAKFYLHTSEGEAALIKGVHLPEKTQEDALEKTRLLLEMLPSNNLDTLPEFQPTKPQGITAADCGMALVEKLADAGTLLLLQPEYASCMTTALGSIGGQVVGILATNPEKGGLCANGANKAARFIGFCDTFSIPIVTLLDLQKLCAEENVQTIQHFARLAHAFADASTVKLTVICGDAVGFSYIALAGQSADLTLAWEDAAISALPFDAAVEFLWHDKLKGASNLVQQRDALANEYRKTQASAYKAAEDGVVDRVISPQETQNSILQALQAMRNKRVIQLPKKHGNMPL